jgi:predicted dehydrogenase
MRPLRIAVVGCGYWGPNLVRNFAAAPDTEVAAVCDVNEARAQALARRLRVANVRTNVADVLADETVDAVALATPIATHRALGEAALRAGKHLWVEKPLASTVADAEALVTLAKDVDRRLFVDHTFLYTPAVRKIRELIDSGGIGDALYFDSTRVNLGLFQSDTNVLWDLAPHDVSIAQYVLGRRPREVSAIGVRHVDGATENMAFVTMRYEGKLVAHLNFNWLAPMKVRLTMIGGTRKMIVYDDTQTDEKVKVYEKGIDVAPADLDARRGILVSYRSGDMWSPRLDSMEALAAAAKEFVSSIAEHRPPTTDGVAGLDVVRVLAAAQDSMNRNGEFVPV